jgi:YggT family protein
MGMFVLGNLLMAVADILGWILWALQVVIIARVVLSWVNADPYNALVRAVVAIAEPLLKPFRRLLPPWRTGGLDLSPIFAILALFFLSKFLVATLYDIALRLK